MGTRKSIGSALLTVAVLFTLIGQAVATSPGGSGPDDALTPSGNWEQLETGESRWYAFQYTGDGSQIDITLQVEPHGGAGFAVWTPEAIRDWGLGLEAEPVGRGSTGSQAEGILSWSGSFTIPGTYYAVVEHSGSPPGTSHYLLEIRGDGVSLAAPEATAAPEPQPAKAKPQSTAPSKPTGKLVFQTTLGGPFYVVNADGSGLRRITDGADPTWSPDGTQIAFVRWREPRGVWVVDADGSNEWRAFDWSEARWPSWSPDGTQILFSRQYGGRTDEVEKCFWGFCFTIAPHPHWKLGIVRLSDGDFREPPASQFSLAPAWSPDGSRIVYADEQGLRVQSEDEVSYLITDDGRDTGPAWSPDGSKVAFTRRQHDHWEVYVVDTDGRNLRRLTDTPRRSNGEVGNSAAAAWSPDGLHLAFLTDRSGKWEIWIMRAGGSGQKPMFPEALEGLALEYASLGERAISWTR
jgi:TolB protein